MAPNALVDADPPIAVALLVSQGTDRLDALLDATGSGARFEIVAGIADRDPSPAAARLDEHGVPTQRLDLAAFLDERDASLDDRKAREAFDRRLVTELEAHEPDLVALCGYLHVVTAPVLEAFAPALVNVHHADVTQQAPDGTPIYDGLHAVREAIEEGEPATRACVHVVTEDVDAGPVLARSRPFPVHEPLVASAKNQDRTEVLKAYAFAHRRWMAREGGGPLLARTLDAIAEGRLALEGDTVLLDGEPGRLDAPATSSAP